MQQDNVQKVRDRIDVADLVGEYIKLQKAGVNFKACCPFHNEKTPSFYVSPERQIWHCFGCSKGGSIFDFVMEMEGIEFSEALQTLARRAGIELGNYDNKTSNQRLILFDINQRAAKFFEKQLWQSNIGKKAQKYLNDRGTSSDSIRNFNLGFAPDSWESLFNYLKKCGFKSADIQMTGLIIKSDSNKAISSGVDAGYYDRFRSRIVFPISDSGGRVVGFSGRIFPSKKNDNIAKYINTPQTVLYDKSKILYGLDKSRLDIKKEGRCLVVEGNMDVVMSHQAGVENCVASSGTALTGQQINILKRLTNKIDLCFDTDDAGNRATDKGVANALNVGMEVSLVELDDAQAKDPADFIKLHGQQWRKKVESRKPVVEYYFRQAFNNYDSKTVDGKRLIANRLLPLLKSVSNAVERAHWIAELASRINTPESDIRTEIEKTNSFIDSFSNVQNINTTDINSSRSSSHLDEADSNVIENYTVSLLLKRPLWYKNNYTKVEEGMFSEVAQLVLNKLKDYSSSDLDISKFISSFDDRVREKMEVWYLLSQAQWQDINEEEFEEEFSKLTFYLRKKYIKAKLTSLEGEINEAERLKNDDLVAKLLKKFSELSKRV